MIITEKYIETRYKLEEELSEILKNTKLGTLS